MKKWILGLVLTSGLVACSDNEPEPITVSSFNDQNGSEVYSVDQSFLSSFDFSSGENKSWSAVGLYEDAIDTLEIKQPLVSSSDIAVYKHSLGWCDITKGDYWNVSHIRANYEGVEYNVALSNGIQLFKSEINFGNSWNDDYSWEFKGIYEEGFAGMTTDSIHVKRSGVFKFACDGWGKLQFQDEKINALRLRERNEYRDSVWVKVQGDWTLVESELKNNELIRMVSDEFSKDVLIISVNETGEYDSIKFIND